MKSGPPNDSAFAILEAPAVCSECKSVSRLTNGLCLNCLLRGALDNESASAGREAFKEALAAVKSRDGDWHIADHEILDEIARGGMGVVYQAREPHSGRIVALKCVLAYQGDSDHAVARFRREAETAARLDHPNIVPIYQVGETADGFPYYTMKYAVAGSLLQARHPLLQHPRQSAALMVKVARAVHHAHEKGVLHRDLKPGNILLDSHGEPLVSDFGLARCDAVSSYLTRSLSSFGTPGYIAPEQAEGPAAQLTPAADIYSLGAILFELLTGRTPFVGDNAFAVMKQSAEEAAPKVRALAPHVDRDLETICGHCLERNPADRYQSATALADDLQNWLDEQPIIARPAGVWLKSRRWLRHNRTLAALLAAFCLLGAGSLIWQIRAEKIQVAMREKVSAERSVAILPFLNLDTVATDPAATQLLLPLLQPQLDSFGPAKITTAEVPGWSKLEDIRNAARDLRCRTILTGTTREVAGKKRISLRLLDPATGQTLLAKLWEQSADRKELRSAAQELAQGLNSILSAGDWSDVIRARTDPGRRNEVAAEAMKAGREWMLRYTVADIDQAIALFRRAVEAEPNSAMAHSLLASAAISRTHFAADLGFLEQGKAEARKALELSPQSLDAHRALAGVYYQEGKFREALEEQMRTIEIGGVDERTANFAGMTFDMLGRPDRALVWYQVSAKLQGTPGEPDRLIGDSWVKLGDDNEARKAYDRSIELRPGSSHGVVGKCHIQLLQGNFDAAREICRTQLGNRNELGDMAQIAAQIELFARNFAAADELYHKLAIGDADGGGSFYGAVTYRSALGRAKQALGENAVAQPLLEDCLAKERSIVDLQPENPEAFYRLAAVEGCLGMLEPSFSHLRTAVALGWVDYRSLSLDPRFDLLRGPELQTIINDLSAKVADLRKNKTDR